MRLLARADRSLRPSGQPRSSHDNHRQLILIPIRSYNDSDENICGMPTSSHYTDNQSQYMSKQAPLMQTLTTSDMASLFDPTQPTQPHPALLPCLVKVYYEHIHPTIPIISSECIVSQYLTSLLNPALANALAALASPYVLIFQTSHVPYSLELGMRRLCLNSPVRTLPGYLANTLPCLRLATQLDYLEHARNTDLEYRRRSRPTCQRPRVRTWLLLSSWRG